MFLTVLHRLFVSGSDRAADRWREDYRIVGVDGLDLHHLYRAMAWLGEELPAKDQDGRTPFAPRCIKDLIEERLFAHRRDLFTRLDLVFMDTTSLYFEGAGGQTLGRYGYSKDTGFRRYLKTISDEHFAIGPDKVEEENKFDGIFVLRTNTTSIGWKPGSATSNCGRWSKPSEQPNTCSRPGRSSISSTRPSAATYSAAGRFYQRVIFSGAVVRADQLLIYADRNWVMSQWVALRNTRRSCDGDLAQEIKRLML